MHDDLNWDHFDDLIDSYASAYVYEGRRQELELQISSVSKSIASARPTMDDFTYFLDTGLTGKGAVQRKIAWASQHIFSMRAWAVGPALFEKQNREYFSPILKQLAALDLAAKPIDTHEFRRSAHQRSKYWSQATLDAMLVDPARERVVLVKGLGWSQAKAIEPSICGGTPGGGLFDPPDRVFQNVYARSEAVRPLLHARDLIEKVNPQIEVLVCYVLVDDPGCSWNYQVHDVSKVTLGALKSSKRFLLDEVPCIGTYLDKRTALLGDSDAFAQLPMLLGSDLLSLVPVDRPCRAMMQLQEVFSSQELSPNELCVLPAAEIADRVEKRFRIFYPANRQRHDIEACLRTGGFVRRLRDSENSYAITPKGFARSMLMRQKFQPQANFSPSRIVAAIQRQADLWFKARRSNRI